ncbi:MAG: ATPase [Pyrodictiaceae archaeon]
MARIALLSGGKDSFYAASMYWPPDIGLILDYDAPIASPHLVNLSKTIETLRLAGLSRILVLHLHRGREMKDLINALRMLNATEIIAGDVYIEDHLKYMESVASEAGARLREPLWGADPEELAYKIFLDEGYQALVIGAIHRLSHWLGRSLDKNIIAMFVEEARKLGLDPLGENGEYHTVLLRTPLHRKQLGYRLVDRIYEANHVMLRLV